MATVRHRCLCRSGDDCPGAAPGHGQWYFRISIGMGRDGRRRQLYRSGFDTPEAAAEAMNISRDVGALISAAKRPGCMTIAYRTSAAQILAEDLQRFSFSGSKDGHVYVIEAAPYLKIGYAADPKQRLAQIRYPSTKGRLVEPPDLDRTLCALWLTLPGSKADEKAVQHLARNYWMCGEWFHADAPLVEGLHAAFYDVKVGAR